MLLQPNWTTPPQYGLHWWLTQCAKTTLSLSVGKTLYKGVNAAGVSCHGPPTTAPPCISPASTSPSPVCINDRIQLVGGQSSTEGILEYCFNGQWSHFCTLQPQEATVACKTLGYTHYSGKSMNNLVDYRLWICFAGAGIFTDGQSFGSSNSSYSLFQNISCSNSESIQDFNGCTLHEVIDCLPLCYPIGIKCYGK